MKFLKNEKNVYYQNLAIESLQDSCQTGRKFLQDKTKKLLVLSDSPAVFAKTVLRVGGVLYSASQSTYLYMKKFNKTESPIFIILCVLCFQKQPFRVFFFFFFLFTATDEGLISTLTCPEDVISHDATQMFSVMKQTDYP